MSSLFIYFKFKYINGPIVWQNMRLTKIEINMFIIVVTCLKCSSVQFVCKVVSDSAVLWTALHQASLSIISSWILLKLMFIELVMPSNHLILFCPILLLPSIFSSIRVFSNEPALCIRYPNMGSSASASVLPINIQDWFPLGLTFWISLQSKWLSRVFPQNTKKSSILCSAFFMVKLSHPYMTIGKTIALTIWTFLAKWCLCFLILCLGLS